MAVSSNTRAPLAVATGWICFFLLVSTVVAQSEQSLSITEAARQARERRERSGKAPKVFTNEDLERLSREQRQLRILMPRPRGKPELTFPPFHRRILVNADATQIEAGGCDTSYAAELKLEINALEEQLAALQRETTLPQNPVSNSDWDPQYFRSGQVGLDVGAPPRSDAEPQVPARVAEVQVQGTLEALRKELRALCMPSEAADIQRRLDEAEYNLDWARRKFALDQEAYYQQPASPSGASGNAWLTSEREQVEQLESEVVQLKAQLSTLLPPVAP
jgi:hypothetical protein